MDTGQTVVIAIALIGIVFVSAGSVLKRRFGIALSHTGIGRPFPIWHSALAVLGNVLIGAGVLGVLISAMILFL